MTDDNQTIIADVKSNNLKNTLINNKKSIIGILIFILILLFGYFFYSDFKNEKKVQISEKYNLAVISYEKDNPSTSITEMKAIINLKDPTYSPLALYFLIDNELLINKNELNEYFDILINNVDLHDEIKKLIIYKKGLYNSDTASEDELLEIFKPLINTQNLWKSHALYVLAEYFFSKDEKQKSKEFFEKIIELDNPNPQIKIEAQKRLQRDFSV
tara:strand:+ start:1464 stop:2108 length:645 start_codon:yes stop_codon:yes gene_type:complete